MLADGASMNLCRYSDEPFNTNEVIWPHWSKIPFHPPTLAALAQFRDHREPRNLAHEARRRAARLQTA